MAKLVNLIVTYVEMDKFSWTEIVKVLISVQIINTSMELNAYAFKDMR